MKKNWRTFSESRTFIHSLQLKNVNAWYKFIKSDDRPVDIPTSPRRVYKKEWKGWGDFLGTGRIANQNYWKEKYVSFKDARKFARSLKLKSGREWLEYCKSGKKPDDIPTFPSQTYEDRGWSNWVDYLDSDGKFAKNRKFWSFKKARKFVHSLNLKSSPEWREYFKSDNRPIELPSNPKRVYQKEWKSMGDWLGTGSIASFNMEFRPFKDARKFVRSLKFKNQTEWREWIKSGKKPDDIPSLPNRTYKKEWKSMGDWLGTGTIAHQSRKFRPFEDARKFVRSLKFKNRKQWTKYYKSGKKPLDIPAAPDRTYKNNGWISMGDFLGTGYIAPQSRKFRPFEDARDFVRKLGLKNFEAWTKYYKSGKKPDDIPSLPQRTYKEEFVSIGDWLGTGSIGGIVKAANYLSWSEAQPIYKKLAKQYGLNGRADWNRFASAHKKLLDDLLLPALPWRAYTKERVWKKIKK